MTEPFVRPIEDTPGAWRELLRRQIARQKLVPVEAVTLSEDGTRATVSIGAVDARFIILYQQPPSR